MEEKIEVDIQILIAEYEAQVNALSRENLYLKAMLKQSQNKVVELTKEPEKGSKK